MSARATLRVCLVGAGPRGTSVLERLCANADGRPVEVHVVDPYPPGPGGVWRTHQSDHLLMNTVTSQISLYTDDSVPCEGPVVPGPSLYEWARLVVAGAVECAEPVASQASSLGPDDYPTRAFYGRYLDWVFQRLVATAPGSVAISVHAGTAVAVDDDEDGTQTVTLLDGSRLTGLDAVVLALGHGPLARSREQDENRRFARRHRLAHVEPANPADVDLSAIAPGTVVAVRGVGLNFFDYLALLTVGRGGRFHRVADGLRYEPSGLEPVLHAGSRRGIPYHARGENQKGAHGRHQPFFLTEEVIAGLRARAGSGEPVGFRKAVWPLVDREVRAVYYGILIRAASGDVDSDSFTRSFVDGDPAEDDALLEKYGVPVEQRWDWALVERPQGDRVFGGREEFQAWLLEHLHQDVRQARMGNLSSPLKSALDVLRDLRNEIRLVVDHGGISGTSYRDELEGWYSPLNAFTSIGPPARRVEEMIALVEAGVLHAVGPGIRIRRSTAEGVFLVDSQEVPGDPVRCRALVEARLPDVDVRRSANPLLRYLLTTGRSRPYLVGGYESGGLAVTGRPYRLVDRTGAAHPARFAFGVPTEGVHWVTAAGIRPGVGSVTLEDADAIARAVLTIHSPYRSATA
ncbi:FAD/NAD(P)-binding protein [Umezawaea tangerina]|uniref:FAD-NAD(P)-binding protein n=1 Tax=Umezawaea tangerina TaxID=84725 RepID=A0A2T0SZJ3_9PSEU|nr:FAD/NAD(P)-binding protein [Umezawaea tangerina]PRY38827.1 FAD-NAD(P)-binding protein [Umezawaea tangerina]